MRPVDQLDITVLMLTHDHGDVLPTALAHLEHQTLPAARFEILVVDFGSSDNTPDILENYSLGAPVSTRWFRVDEGTPGAARNAGVRQARGKMVVLLDDLLLASPRLLEQHLIAHQGQAAPICGVGEVAFHPQIDIATPAARKVALRNQRLAKTHPLPCLDWRAQNLSISKSVLLEAGGFDEQFMFGHFSDAELAARLTKRGIEGRYLSDAHAYIWRRTSIDEERWRQYTKGYSYFTLEHKTGLQGPPDVKRVRLGLGLDYLAIGLYAQACNQLDQNTRIYNHLYRQVISHEFSRGYADARRGRQPRPGHQPE